MTNCIGDWAILSYSRLRIVALITGVLLASCGGGGGAYSPVSQSPNASPGGIWRGTESVTGLEVIGHIEEPGDGHFIRSDYLQFVGTVMTSGDSISGSGEAFEPFGSTFPDGSTHGNGTISGTIVPRTSITAETDFTTDAGTHYSGTVSGTFDPLYNELSSLSTIAGNYTDPVTGTVVTINSNGDVFAQDANSGCVVSGNVSIINASYNAYHVAVSYSNCQGTFAALNGVTFTGLATLDDKLSPARLYSGFTGKNGSTKYAIVYTLTRS